MRVSSLYTHTFLGSSVEKTVSSLCHLLHSTPVGFSHCTTVCSCIKVKSSALHSCGVPALHSCMILHHCGSPALQVSVTGLQLPPYSSTHAQGQPTTPKPCCVALHVVSKLTCNAKIDMHSKKWHMLQKWHKVQKWAYGAKKGISRLVCCSPTPSIHLLLGLSVA